MERVRVSIGAYHGLAVDSAGRSGGLAFLWRKDVVCQLRSMAMHHMDFTIQVGQEPWRVTGFYGWPEVANRFLSWKLLQELAREADVPWVCMGDFNEVLRSSEMKGGERPLRQMAEFREAIDSCGLLEMDAVGYEFTFDNGQAGLANRQCRLDRAVMTAGWQEMFPRAKLIHLDREWSDHAPIKLLLDTEGRGVDRKAKLFRFEHAWVDEEGCEDVIRMAWDTGGRDVAQKIHKCSVELRKWKGSGFGQVVRELQKKRRLLKRLNEGNRSAERVSERKRIVAEIAYLRGQEEK